MDKTFIMETLQLVLGVFGFVIALCQYRKYVEQNKHAVMAEYNQRYNDDKNIEAVVKYLIRFLENKETENEKDSKALTIYQKEMFMRFFEELQLQVENNRIGEGKIEDFFAYYAVAACMCPDFVEGTELIGDDDLVWERFRTFVKSYPRLKAMVASDYKKHHNDNTSIEFLIK